MYHLMQAAGDGAQVDRPRREAHFSHGLARTSFVAFEKKELPPAIQRQPHMQDAGASIKVLRLLEPGRRFEEVQLADGRKPLVHGPLHEVLPVFRDWIPRPVPLEPSR